MVIPIVENEIFPGRYVWSCSMCDQKVSNANVPQGSCSDCGIKTLYLKKVDEGLGEF